MDRVRFIPPQNCCVFVSHVSTLDFCAVHTYLLDCLNDSACDDKRRVCMLYVVKWIWKSTTTEQCNAGEDRLYMGAAAEVPSGVSIGGWSCLPCASQRRDASAKKFV
jgi:hypothetical protein